MDTDQSNPVLWQPTKYVRYVDCVAGTNARPAIVITDAGPAYLKPMDEGESPAVLAVELICTRLARWFGVPVPDAAIIRLHESDIFARPRAFDDDRPPIKCVAGPAFCTREELSAVHWDGKAKSLKKIVNASDIPRLVVFDTLVRNWDRFPPLAPDGTMDHRKPNYGNVLIVGPVNRAASPRLVAIDFGRALDAGLGIPSKGYGIERDQAESIFGLFPPFRPYMTQDLVRSAVDQLSRLDRPLIEGVVAKVPDEWDLSVAKRNAIVSHIVGRARFLADRIETLLRPHCGWQGDLFKP